MLAIDCCEYDAHDSEQDGCSQDECGEYRRDWNIHHVWHTCNEANKKCFKSLCLASILCFRASNAISSLLNVPAQKQIESVTCSCWKHFLPWQPNDNSRERLGIRSKIFSAVKVDCQMMNSVHSGGWPDLRTGMSGNTTRFTMRHHVCLLWNSNSLHASNFLSFPSKEAASDEHIRVCGCARINICR